MAKIKEMTPDVCQDVRYLEFSHAVDEWKLVRHLWKTAPSKGEGVHSSTSGLTPSYRYSIRNMYVTCTNRYVQGCLLK